MATPALRSNANPDQPLCIENFKRKRTTVGPQSFPPVKLSDPTNPFSAPLPRQRIKAGMLVTSSANGHSVGTLPHGKWFARVVKTKSESPDNMWHVRVLGTTSAPYGLTPAATSSTSWRVYTTSNVKLVNPNCTITASQQITVDRNYQPGTDLWNQLFNSPSDTDPRLNFTEPDRYGRRVFLLGPLAAAYLLAENTLNSPEARRAYSGASPWTVPQARIGALSNHELAIRGMNIRRREHFPIDAYGENEYKSKRRIQTKNLVAYFRVLKVIGTALGSAIADLRRMSDGVSPSEVSAVRDKLDAAIRSLDPYQAHRDAFIRFDEIVAGRWGWQVNGCGHFGAGQSVRVTGFGDTQNHCQACVEKNLAANVYRRVLDEHDNEILMDVRYIRVYDLGDGVWSIKQPLDVIGGYHSSRAHFKKPMPHITGRVPAKGPFVGFELEFVRGDSASKSIQNLAGLMKKTLAPFDKMVKQSGQGNHYALFEYDGSVDFEMVTGFGPMDIHRAAVVELLGTGAWKGQLKSHDGGRCGLHVHLDKPTSLIHATRMTEFYNKEENARLIKCVARRYGAGERYAKTVEGKGDKAQLGKSWSCAVRNIIGSDMPKYSRIVSRKSIIARAVRNLTEERYELVNFSPDRTVEIRAFRGSMLASTVIACLEFAYISWFFARDCVDMSTDAFIEFISRTEWRHETRYLRKYLLDKGYTPWVPRAAPTVAEAVSVEDETEAVPLPVFHYEITAERAKREAELVAQGFTRGPMPSSATGLFDAWIRGYENLLPCITVRDIMPENVTWYRPMEFPAMPGGEGWKRNDGARHPGVDAGTRIDTMYLCGARESARAGDFNWGSLTDRYSIAYWRVHVREQPALPEGFTQLSPQESRMPPAGIGPNDTIEALLHNNERVTSTARGFRWNSSDSRSDIFAYRVLHRDATATTVVAGYSIAA